MYQIDIKMEYFRICAFSNSNFTCTSIFVFKEKETVKQQLQSAERELAKRSEDADLGAVLAEKDEQIAGLMEEGEKLSKQQLNNSNIIKKLRAKEKENDSLISSQK